MRRGEEHVQVVVAFQVKDLHKAGDRGGHPAQRKDDGVERQLAKEPCL